MAPKLPRGFIIPSKEAKGKEPVERARPVQKKKTGKTILLDTPPGATVIPTVAEASNDAPPAKRPRTEGASNHLEALMSAAAKSVGENEVHAWQALEGEEEAHSMLRLSTQLVIHSLGRAKAAQQERLKRDRLEADNKRLAAMVVENDNKWKRDLDAKTAELTIKNADFNVVKADLDQALQHNDLLAGMVDNLTAERDDLRARLAKMEEEREVFGDSQFEKGFNFYLVGFMAHDPGYDWSRFGPECVEDMKGFLVEHAAEIRARRVQLGLEDDAPEDEGAPTSVALLDGTSENIPVEVQVQVPQDAEVQVPPDAQVPQEAQVPPPQGAP